MNDAVEFALLLKSHGPERAKELISQRYSMYGDQKPLLVLHDKQLDPHATSASSNKSRKGRKSKANATLQQFLKSPKEYNRYVRLNELWLGYMKTVLDNKTDAANKILTADWHGAEISVETAKSPGYVGKRGILLWEGRTMIVIISATNKLCKIPKRGCVFRLHGLNRMVRVIGDRVLCRSGERTTRKFKPHDVQDIQWLLAE